MCEAVYEVDKDIIFMGLAGSKMINGSSKKSVSALQVRSSLTALTTMTELSYQESFRVQ